MTNIARVIHTCRENLPTKKLEMCLSLSFVCLMMMEVHIVFEITIEIQSQNPMSEIDLKIIKTIQYVNNDNDLIFIKFQ